MAVAVRSNGLHHAVSLGAIEVSSKPGYSSRNYDSEDDSSRRRLRHTSSTELYPKKSIYSKGDIREQYCLTDRQLNSIERPRREGFFGCLSRRSARSQSFLGVCVGRRAPSDENIAAYAPFHKYPRYHQYGRDDNSPNADMDTSYFRRQPASILSTGKMTNDTMNIDMISNDNRQNWIPHQNTINANENTKISTEEATSTGAYHCPSHGGLHVGVAQQITPRTKHVSFARSHTLTSFNDPNLGFRSLDRVKAAQSQERLIGGKKAAYESAHIYATAQRQHQHQQQLEAMPTQILGSTTPFTIHHPQHPQPQLIQHAQFAPAETHLHAIRPAIGGHSHHHHLPVHIHQYVPSYNTELMTKVQTEQPLPLGVGVIACAAQAFPPSSPEVVIVEKKFRNAMKTQATQTELRKEGLIPGLQVSPRSIHKIRVVSQGAQTNGMQNKPRLVKNSLEIPETQMLYSTDRALQTHDTLAYKPLASGMGYATSEAQNAIEYYERPAPPPLSSYRRSSYPSMEERDSEQSPENMANAQNECHFKEFDYESHSLPRRTCSHQATVNEFGSHSLPRHGTDSSTIISEPLILDYATPHLLPPPQQFGKTSNDEEDIDEALQPSPTPTQDVNRRKSMAAIMQRESETDIPFRRDDIRRQSMPVYVKTERLIDGYAPRSSFRMRDRPRSKLFRGGSDEKEIFIDFKPHMSPKPSPKLHHRLRRDHKTTDHQTVVAVAKPDVSNQVVEQEDSENDEECDSCSSSAQENSEPKDEDDIIANEDPMYENVPVSCACQVQDMKREQFRKRSVSLDNDEYAEKKGLGISSPSSPCRGDIIADVSTYPSSDSLANDVTRDHSDGIWNESQATVLTAEQKDPLDSNYLTSNLLLTPSSRRRSLMLQHQQRSSVDTDALDYEDQLTDHSPIYSNVLATKLSKTMNAEPTTLNFDVPTKMITPSIAVTPSSQHSESQTQAKTWNTNVRQSPSPTLNAIGQQDNGKAEPPFHSMRKNFDKPSSYGSRTEMPAYKFNLTNTDVSECSTNTDEYATCTDTSKRTPGIKTPPTTTNSSSTTQVPVSTQSSQMDKSHGSSFESASSLYSSRGEILTEEVLQHDEKLTSKHTSELTLGTLPISTNVARKSPSHSISSTSSGSYKNARITTTDNVPDLESSKLVGQSPATAPTTNEVVFKREKPKPRPESVSEDERSEMRYSSSGYYESPPHDDVEQNVAKSRRYRLDEERKRRKTSMKLDIEKENMRALTSPIKRATTTTATVTATGTILEKSPEKPANSVLNETTSPNKVKRRPKVRRQLRRTSRDDSTPRRPKTGIYSGTSLLTGNSEKLLDCSIKPTQNSTTPAPKAEETLSTLVEKPKVKSVSAVSTVKSASEGGIAAGSGQLKAKSIESLRSVSPGSDSVFYSEADGTVGEQHCQHCGKEMEGDSTVPGMLRGDSIESIPYIENDQEQVSEHDIVKPPSDFADSPVIIKPTQRLYKKMDRRFRSEERYHGERGRHYKSRQENIRAKSEERNREQSTRSPHTLRPSGSSPCVLPETSFEQNQQVVYRGHYDDGRYLRLTDTDLWAQLDHQSFDRQRERRASTESERSFHSKYQVILHRLVQRRCTLEMYHRQKNNEFCVDKTVVVKSDSGEFGFRIHGSKPVVVAAIEPDTPAESSGLEVGDIIISVNGVQVLDKHHTEVVKIAHDGCETLELQVARTIGILMSEQQEPQSGSICSGYLWRQSGQAKGTPNTKKWVRRWFCLRSDNCLYYYKTEGSTQPVGAMIMAKHSVEHCSPEVGKPHAFKVDCGEGVPLFVAGDSEELTNRWMKVLKQAASQTNPWLDNCSRYLYQQPSSILRPDCFGYLLKLGSRWCGWSKRYCVLKDACLYFYQDANSKTSFGMACLHGYKVATMSTNASGKKNSFEIIPPESKLRHYYFCAESEMDKKRWISALEYSIDRWIKSG